MKRKSKHQTATFNNPAIYLSLKKAGLQLIGLPSPGTFQITNSRTTLTLIITDSSQTTARSPKGRKPIDDNFFSTWEVSRWLKKY